MCNIHNIEMIYVRVCRSWVARCDMTERAMHAGEPICKMQSLQLNNLKHIRNENPFSHALPQLPSVQTDDKCRIRSQSTLNEKAGDASVLRRHYIPIRGFAVMRFRREISIAPEQFSAAQMHKTWHKTCWNCTECNAKQCFANIP